MSSLAQPPTIQLAMEFMGWLLAAVLGTVAASALLIAFMIGIARRDRPK
ncbi:MAG: hypothetical protein JNL28_01260 [Planctomycetes bacterium]|nr:hypothetical protein [Planctomycetota bacterium]